MTVLLVALGAAIGACLRLLVSRRLAGAPGTLAVNVAGSFALGLLGAGSGSSYALLGVGFCGALTTFGAFAIEAVEQGPRWTLGYTTVTVTGCLLAAALGSALG